LRKHRKFHLKIHLFLLQKTKLLNSIRTIRYLGENQVKRKTWKQKLTKKEREHLSENGIKTKYGLEKQMTYMKELERDFPNRPCPCWECKSILTKLGMWD